MLSVVILSDVIMLRGVMLLVIQSVTFYCYAEDHCAEFHYTESGEDKGRIHNASFSLKVKHGSNKLECYVTSG